jgi:hypothetical protein
MRRRPDKGNREGARLIRFLDRFALMRLPLAKRLETRRNMLPQQGLRLPQTNFQRSGQRPGTPPSTADLRPLGLRLKGRTGRSNASKWNVSCFIRWRMRQPLFIGRRIARRRMASLQPLLIADGLTARKLIARACVEPPMRPLMLTKMRYTIMISHLWTLNDKLNYFQ